MLGAHLVIITLGDLLGGPLGDYLGPPWGILGEPPVLSLRSPLEGSPPGAPPGPLGRPPGYLRATFNGTWGDPGED